MLLNSLRTALRRVTAPRIIVALSGGVALGIGCVGSSALCDNAKTKACNAAPSTAAAAAEEKSGPTFEFRCLAEAIGTAILVQGGCGAVCAAKYAGMPTPTVPMMWGLSVTLAIYVVGSISGAHLNPAVTAGLVAADKFPVEEAPLYMLAQTVGAALAGAVNYAIFAGAIAAHEAAGGIVRGAAASTASFHGAFGLVPEAALISPVGALLAEAWVSACLVFMVFAITDPNGAVPEHAAPVAVGATVTTLICILAPLTGCGMNPARDLGPRLVTLLAGWGGAAASSAWIYTLGPLAGGVIGALAYQQVFAAHKQRATAAAKRDT